MGGEFRQANQLAKSAQSILLISHELPDGDAIGSMLAFRLALERESKKVECFTPTKIPPCFNFLPEANEIKYDVSLLTNTFDLAIALDYGDFRRTGFDGKLKKKLKTRTIVTFDHHPQGRYFEGLTIIEPNFSSTAEIIYNYFKETGFAIKKDIADCLLTGIFTDTGGFKHANTSCQCLEATGDLILKGASLAKIIRNVLGTKTLGSCKIWAKALANIGYEENIGMVYIIISDKDLRQCGATREDTAGIANLLSTIPEVKFSLVLISLQNKIIEGSLRSESFKETDVSKIARLFGGGGYKLAAGFRTKGQYDDILRKVKKHLC